MVSLDSLHPFAVTPPIGISVSHTYTLYTLYIHSHTLNNLFNMVSLNIAVYQAGNIAWHGSNWRRQMATPEDRSTEHLETTMAECEKIPGRKEDSSCDVRARGNRLRESITVEGVYGALEYWGYRQNSQFWRRVQKLQRLPIVVSVFEYAQLGLSEALFPSNRLRQNPHLP